MCRLVTSFGMLVHFWCVHGGRLISFRRNFHMTDSLGRSANQMPCLVFLSLHCVYLLCYPISHRQGPQCEVGACRVGYHRLLTVWVQSTATCADGIFFRQASGPRVGRDKGRPRKLVIWAKHLRKLVIVHPSTAPGCISVSLKLALVLKLHV